MSKDGKYNDECEALMSAAGAAVALAVIMDGREGHGFSVCVNGTRTCPHCAVDDLPEILRRIANEIEQQAQQAGIGHEHKGNRERLQ